MEPPFIRIALHSVPVILVLGLILYVLLRNSAARKQQAQGILWLQAMRALITHIQKHRGLSSGVLSGEKRLQSELENMQKQVSRDFEQISSVGDWIKAQQEWQLITQHWARLAGNIYKLPVARNIDQHNRLIKNILVFVDEIAESHYLNSPTAARSVNWRDLLALAELIGQVRANGTAVTAAQLDWESARAEKAKRDLQRLVQDIFSTLEDPHCRLGLTEAALQDVLDFLAYVDEKVLIEGPIVTASEFYQRASSVLDALYQRFDEQLASINRRLSS